jgi:hypothetical protein
MQRPSTAETVYTMIILVLIFSRGWIDLREGVDARRIASLRGQGRSWSQITSETGVSKGTAQRAIASLPKTPIAAVL